MQRAARQEEDAFNRRGGVISVKNFGPLREAHAAYCQALAALDALDDASEPLKEAA